jgi:NitT/TauT family transport system substrate-binding protein
MLANPFRVLLSIALCLSLVSCARQDKGSNGLTRVRLQTDWFPQAEHGGFYQALAKGFYREAGLEVDLLPGGPGAHIKPKIAGGDAEFGMNPSIDIIVAAGRGLPLVMVGAYFQHDPQALLLHDDNPIRSFEQLDGKTVIASPGLAWIQYLQKKYSIKLNLQPVPYGLAQFMADRSAIRQCVITNEPYLARQQGASIRTMRLADAGYDGYHIIFCKRDFAREHPDVVRAFVEASLKGWKDYVEGDPEPAHRMILERNRNMTPEFLQYSRSEMIRNQLVSGDPSKGEYIGLFRPDRVSEIIKMLHEVGMLEQPVPVREVFWPLGKQN